MQLKKREARRILDKLEMETRATHHVIAWFTYQGRKILKTRIFFGQLKLNQADFIALKDCPLDREGYIAILRDKGLLPE